MSIAKTLLGEAGDPPDREWVLNQGFTRNLAESRAKLPDGRLWPAELDHCPQRGGRHRIDRRTLFAIAERVVVSADDIWGAAQLHAAIALWGAHPGRDTVRALRPLADRGAPERLTRALQVVRGEGPASAYKALSRGGRLNLPGLGPSFYTKFLYFGGYGAKPLLSEPLIMDDRVIVALEDLTKERWHEGSGDDYIRYLDLARDIAFDLDTSEDVVERLLWERGAKATGSCST